MNVAKLIKKISAFLALSLALNTIPMQVMAFPADDLKDGHSSSSDDTIHVVSDADRNSDFGSDASLRFQSSSDATIVEHSDNDPTDSDPTFVVTDKDDRAFVAANSLLNPQEDLATWLRTMIVHCEEKRLNDSKKAGQWEQLKKALENDLASLGRQSHSENKKLCVDKNTLDYYVSKYMAIDQGKLKLNDSDSDSENEIPLQPPVQKPVKQLQQKELPKKPKRQREKSVEEIFSKEVQDFVMEQESQTNDNDAVDNKLAEALARTFGTGPKNDNNDNNDDVKPKANDQLEPHIIQQPKAGPSKITLIKNAEGELVPVEDQPEHQSPPKAQINDLPILYNDEEEETRELENDWHMVPAGGHVAEPRYINNDTWANAVYKAGASAGSALQSNLSIGARAAQERIQAAATRSAVRARDEVKRLGAIAGQKALEGAQVAGAYAAQKSKEGAQVAGQKTLAGAKVAGSYAGRKIAHGVKRAAAYARKKAADALKRAMQPRLAAPEQNNNNDQVQAQPEQVQPKVDPNYVFQLVKDQFPTFGGFALGVHNVWQNFKNRFAPVQQPVVEEGQNNLLLPPDDDVHDAQLGDAPVQPLISDDSSSEEIPLDPPAPFRKLQSSDAGTIPVKQAPARFSKPKPQPKAPPVKKAKPLSNNNDSDSEDSDRSYASQRVPQKVDASTQTDANDARVNQPAQPQPVPQPQAPQVGGDGGNNPPPQNPPVDPPSYGKHIAAALGITLVGGALWRLATYIKPAFDDSSLILIKGLRTQLHSQSVILDQVAHDLRICEELMVAARNAQQHNNNMQFVRDLFNRVKDTLNFATLSELEIIRLCIEDKNPQGIIDYVTNFYKPELQRIQREAQAAHDETLAKINDAKKDQIDGPSFASLIKNGVIKDLNKLSSLVGLGQIMQANKNKEDNKQQSTHSLPRVVPQRSGIVDKSDVDCYHEYKQILGGFVHIKQEALKLVNGTSFGWKVTDVFMSDTCAALRRKLGAANTVKLGTYIADLEQSFEISDRETRTITIAQAHTRLNQLLDELKQPIEQEAGTFIKAFDARMKQQPAQRAANPTAPKQKPRSEQPARPSRSEQAPQQQPMQQEQSDELGWQSVLGPAMQWVKQNPKLAATLAGLTVYGVGAEIFGWPPFGAKPEAQNQ